MTTKEYYKHREIATIKEWLERENIPRDFIDIFKKVLHQVYSERARELERHDKKISKIQEELDIERRVREKFQAERDELYDKLIDAKADIKLLLERKDERTES